MVRSGELRTQFEASTRFVVRDPTFENRGRFENIRRMQLDLDGLVQQRPADSQSVDPLRDVKARFRKEARSVRFGDRFGRSGVCHSLPYVRISRKNS